MPKVKQPVVEMAKNQMRELAKVIGGSETTITVQATEMEGRHFIECTIPVLSGSLGEREADVIQGTSSLMALRNNQTWEWYVEAVPDTGTLQVVFWRELPPEDLRPTVAEEKAERRARMDAWRNPDA